MALYQCQITSFHSYSAIALLPVTRLMYQGQAHLHEQFLSGYLGWPFKNGNGIINNWTKPLYHTSFTNCTSSESKDSNEKIFFT